MKLLSVLAVCFYALMTGLGPSVQRASLLYVVFSFSRLLLCHYSLYQKISCCVLLQSLFFPLSVFTVSNMMSWAAYLVVLDISKVDGRKYLAIKSQVQLSTLTAVFIGQWAILGVFVNLLIIPFFVIVFYSSFIFFLGSIVSCSLKETVIYIHDYFIFVLLKLSYVCDIFSFLCIDLAQNTLLSLVRGVLFVISSIYILNICKKVSISL